MSLCEIALIRWPNGPPRSLLANVGTACPSHCADITLTLALTTGVKLFACHPLIPLGHFVPQFSQITQQLLTY